MANINTYEPRHEIFNNVICATSKGSDHSAHTDSLIRTFCLSLKYSMNRTSFGVSKLNKTLHRLICVYTCQRATLLEITCHYIVWHVTWLPTWTYYSMHIVCVIEFRCQSSPFKTHTSNLLVANNKIQVYRVFHHSPGFLHTEFNDANWVIYWKWSRWYCSLHQHYDRHIDAAWTSQIWFTPYQ